MATPELYWKVSTQEAGKPTKLEFLTRGQISTRGLMHQVLNMTEDNAYVRIGPANFQPYSYWKRDQRK